MIENTRFFGENFTLSLIYREKKNHVSNPIEYVVRRLTV